VSESEFDHTNRILCLKVGALVHKVSRLPKCPGYLSIAYLFSGRFTSRFVVAKQDCNFLSLDTQDTERGQLQCARNFLHFITVPVCSHDRYFLSVSDRNHANTPSEKIEPFSPRWLRKAECDRLSATAGNRTRAMEWADILPLSYHDQHVSPL